jgi:Gas vesicle protein
MARRKAPTRSRDWLFPQAAIATRVGQESSLLDVVDRVLNKGAVVHGELVLGVADVDLIYAKLSVLLSAIDRIVEPVPGRKPKRRGKKVKSKK